MINVLKKLCAAGVLLILLIPASTVGMASAATKNAAAASPATTCGEGDTTSKGQILQGAGQTGADCTGVGVNNAIASAVNILSIVVGVAAVIMVIVSGFKYVTSGGDSNSVSSAKSTLIYALVGLGVAGLAQVLVNFVLTNIK